MKLSSFLRSFAVTAIAIAATGRAAQAAPQATGENSRNECRQALQIAGDKFRSDEDSMNAPITLPSHFPARFVLQVTERDISGGDGLVADQAYFTDKAPQDKDHSFLRRVFWQSHAQAGKRIVVVDRVGGWRGDWYYLYVLEENVAPETFVASFHEGNPVDRQFTPALETGLVAPQVLLESKSGKAWILVQSYVAVAMGEWRIHSVAADGFKQRCTVNFMPQVRQSVSLLPGAVKKFDAILTEILGPGTGEGTLQPTARIQSSVNSDWSNAAIRPWAMNNTPYDSRAKVDTNLKQWSEVNARRRAVYRALIGQYPRAEKALAGYYQTRFHLRPEQARAMARYATDLVFRDYFVFSSDVAQATAASTDNDKAFDNPWPAR